MLHFFKVDFFICLNDELRDPFTPHHLEVRRWIGIDEQYLEFTSVAAIDQTGRVQHGHAVFVRQATARLDEARIPIRNGDRDTRRHEGSPATRSDGHVGGCS